MGAVAAVACTSSSPPTPDPSQTPRSPAPSVTLSTAAPPKPQLPEVPLVFAVHHTRLIADVDLGRARRLLSQGATQWDLGQPGSRLRVVDAREGKPDAALDVVRGSTNVLAIVPATAVDATVQVLTVGGINPLREPDRYPLKIRTKTAAEEVTTLTIVGDIMLGRRVGGSLSAGGDWAAPFRPLARQLAAADLTVGNFESTLSRAGPPTQGGDSFAADPRALAGLKLAGFDLVSLANNHVGDFGRQAMLDTFERFTAAELSFVGAGRRLAAARKPVVLTRGQTTVGFIGIEAIGETPAATNSQPGTNRLNMPPRTGPLGERALRRILADVENLAARVDTVVVLPHWGTQYTHRPEPSQRHVARRLIAAGADLVIGGHPHWVQGWEPFGDGIVVHSLGNFVFDMDFSRQTQEGVFVEIILWDGKVKAVEPVPYVIGSDFVVRKANPSRSRLIMEGLRQTSRGPYSVPEN